MVHYSKIECHLSKHVVTDDCPVMVTLAVTKLQIHRIYCLCRVHNHCRAISSNVTMLYYTSRSFEVTSADIAQTVRDSDVLQ